MKPRNYVARAQQSGAGRHTNKLLNEKKARKVQDEALEQNELHSKFFGVPNTPVREIRDRLDPVLQMHAVREITKIYIGENDDGEG
jgi:hypothetical protein